jgi:hypothetical protein
MTTTSELNTKAVERTVCLTRRELLKGSGILIGMLSGASSALLALAPSRTWAVELSVLSEAQGQELMRFARQLYPHDSLDDAAYALVVSALDGAAKSDPATKKLLAEGLRSLDAAAGGSFLRASPRQQLAAVKALEGTPFFEKVRGTTIATLYNNPIAFAYFGYGGSAWEKGGYINRGFDDIKWLPDPPPAASPAKA